MWMPSVGGVIDRRILVNYRVDPEVLARVLPAPFRPLQINGQGLGGICLIRLKQIRPWFLPRAIGFSSENAAHRIAVEWHQDGTRHEGVFVPRRDTSSRLNTLLGGRIFPGVHYHASFEVDETADRFRVEIASDDGAVHVVVAGRRSSGLPPNSVFRSVEEASDTFCRGSLGYSATASQSAFEGLELRTFNWHVDPLAIETVESSYFENDALFPPGSVEFDSAFLMQGIRHEWIGRPPICAGEPAAVCLGPSPRTEPITANRSNTARVPG
jgi:Uncharacterized conserved protein (COG2071)